MFDTSISAKQFLRALQKLNAATENSKPAALHNSVKRILSRTDGFEGSKLDELISFIADPPKPEKPKRASSAKSTKMRPHSAELLKEMLETLSKVENDESAFASAVKKYAAECGAKTIKEAAAVYAASGLPKTKSDAIKLIISERANRIRTELKMQESARARPW
ncbi:MAG: hypothetical protein MK130_05040 [Puniceicoccaceae bacterium]|nr:hypothetical protein [Puniceicoccaceae bacterium]NQY40009.1 hypothetical protein [Henriciella sp.]